MYRAYFINNESIFRVHGPHTHTHYTHTLAACSALFSRPAPKSVAWRTDPSPAPRRLSAVTGHRVLAGPLAAVAQPYADELEKWAGRADPAKPTKDKSSTAPFVPNVTAALRAAARAVQVSTEERIVRVAACYRRASWPRGPRATSLVPGARSTVCVKRTRLTRSRCDSTLGTDRWPTDPARPPSPVPPAARSLLQILSAS